MKFRTILCAAGIIVWAGATAGPAFAGTVVLELYTSQGCSNCPPADSLFADYANRDGVVALSLPVDYWNYLGWDDTLADHAYAERQWGYAMARGQSQVYTPQIMVDGLEAIIGSDRDSIEDAVEDALREDDVFVTVSFAGDGIQIDVGGAVPGQAPRGTLWLILYEREETVTIAGGENAGQTVTYYNVVKRMHRIGMWDGRPMSLEMPMMEMAEVGADGAAVIIQEEMPVGMVGTIIGAGSREIMRNPDN